MSREEKIISGREVPSLAGIAKPFPSSRESLERILVSDLLGVRIETLPFATGDTTVGSETELQAIVAGRKQKVDLPLQIEQSNYFSNILRRAASGDLSGSSLKELDHFLNDNHDAVWENSWVRIPADTLGHLARQTIAGDMLADKADPSKGKRGDFEKFHIVLGNRKYYRMPVSYLLKIALADAVDMGNGLCLSSIAKIGASFMNNFLSDNTSPETFSLYVTGHTDGPGPGKEAARENAKRFLLTQLLVTYANKKFSLSSSGQKVAVFYSPLPPERLKQLNACISDSFYRDLFMNPCLAGWSRGEAKHEYMHLCHQVLSRSQLNAVAKLREAGIITNNLVVLPNTSNISLANNGIHVSLGSRRLTSLMQDDQSRYTKHHEKYIGDLAVKILEHFIPLFITSYSASPYRLDFTDFNPEVALGFLPHELDFTHLRMLWRRWRKKADISILGNPITPFGPPRVDHALRSLFRLKGDYVGDYRLVDYLVALMSTEKSPALNGALHNQERLREDLHDLGVFDRRMSVYSFIKLREYETIGFSGFESRYYSLFASFEDDMARAIDLQNLLHLLAFKYMTRGWVTHAHIPDEPFIESERRQIIFGRAIGIPTFFIKQETGNLFLRRILARTRKSRPSRRYSGYLRVYNNEYCRALLETIREDGADLIEMMGMEETLRDLSARLEDPERHSAFGRLSHEMARKMSGRSALNIEASAFNREMERHYRTTLRQDHIREGWRLFEQDVRSLEGKTAPGVKDKGRMLHRLCGLRDIEGFLESSRQEVLQESISPANVRKLIHILLFTIGDDSERAMRHASNCPCSESPARMPTPSSPGRVFTAAPDSIFSEAK
jgi:hypothetical protein